MDLSTHRASLQHKNEPSSSHSRDSPIPSSSMPQSLRETGRVRGEFTPSDLHIALALAIVQSKPAELTIEDHILRLREHVRSDKRTNGDKASNKRLDPVGYWSTRFKDAEAAQKKSEARIMELEREIESLKTEPRFAQPQPSKKRRNDTPSRGLTSHAKKSRFENETSEPFSANTGKVTLPDNIDILSAVSADGAELIRHLYLAHKLFKGHAQRDHSLAYHLVQASDLLAPLLSHLCHRYQQRTGVLPLGPQDNAGSKEPVAESELAHYDTELTAAFDATARIFMSLHQGLKKLRSEDPISEDYAAVIYSFVNMFDRLLDVLKHLIFTQASQEATATQTSKSRKPMATRRSKKALDNNQQDHLVNRLLSNFLANVLSVPSATESQQHELLEGFLFVLFRRLGSRIYLCTFGHERSETIENDIAAWPDPEELQSKTPVAKTQIDERALCMELPILVTLLERGMAVAQHHIAPLGKAPSRRQNKPFVLRAGPKPSLESLKSSLSLAAKKKLENSLVQAIFGDGSNKDEMMECLTMPVRQALLEPPQKVGHDDVKSWFVERVWGLVGWQAVLDME